MAANVTRILLIDDDLELAEMLAEYLSGDGFQVTLAHDGGSGLAQALEHDFKVIVLDVMLPTMDGFEVLRQLRRDRQTPVLMLTARGDDVDTVVGLELGADDYLPKPCNPRVLVARLRALLRRGSAEREVVDEVLLVDDLRIDPARREVTLSGQPVDLTGAEFDILTRLALDAGRLVDKDELSRVALGRALQPFDRSIDMHISHLRRKLGTLQDGTLRIKTVRGAGYLYVGSR